MTPRSENGDVEEFFAPGHDYDDNWEERINKVNYTPDDCCWVIDPVERDLVIYTTSDLRAKWYEEDFHEEVEVKIACWSSDSRRWV